MKLPDEFFTRVLTEDDKRAKAKMLAAAMGVDIEQEMLDAFERIDQEDAFTGLRTIRKRSKP